MAENPKPLKAKSRYRKRENLRALLVRVLVVMFQHEKGGIPPDQKTARVMRNLRQMLARYIEGAGLDPFELRDPLDMAQVEKAIKDRRKESLKRKTREYRRRFRNG